jgi:hypothetical protein
MPLVLAIVLSVFFIAGGVMLFFPLMIYRTGGSSVYTEEFLNKFGTRVTTRALGVLFMLFCITIVARMLSHSPKLSKGLFAAMYVLFGFVWLSGLLMGIMTWVSPKAKSWTERLSTDRITSHQHRVEIVIGIAALVVSVVLAAFPLIM